MKAIQTRYLPCTEHRGARITAWAEGGLKPHRVTLSYPHELSGEDVHRFAADALMAKMGWKGRLIGGGLPNGDWAFCWEHPAVEFHQALNRCLPDLKHYADTHGEGPAQRLADLLKAMGDTYGAR